MILLLSLLISIEWVFVSCRWQYESLYYVSVKEFFFSLTFKMWTSVLQVISVTAVQLAIIQMDLTHAPVSAATQEMDEPAMVNILPVLDQMHRFHK